MNWKCKWLSDPDNCGGGGGPVYGPMVYANPFNGGLISWIGDPSNDWDLVSYILVGVILCSATC